MGYLTELNTLLRPPKSFEFSSLTEGARYTVTLERERAFPLRIAVLVVDYEWNFYGYAAVHQCVTENRTSTLTFEMLSLFSEEEKALYRRRFLEAAKKTGEV